MEEKRIDKYILRLKKKIVKYNLVGTTCLECFYFRKLSSNIGKEYGVCLTGKSKRTITSPNRGCKMWSPKKS